MGIEVPEGGRRLSICLYTPSVDPSGMGSHMLDLAAEYLPGADVSVLCWDTVSGRRVLDRAAGLGATVHALPHPRDPAFADTIVGFLTRSAPDVFHIHVGSGRENFDGARAARRAGVPAVVQTQHQPWLFRAPRKRVRFGCAIAAVDRLIAVSWAEQRSYERTGVPASRIVTVQNGIVPRGPGPGRPAARAELGLDPDELVVMNIGRLMRQKGQDVLVDAMPGLVAAFPRLRVVVVGGGTLHESLAGQAAALGVADHLCLPGHRTDARMLLDAADVFVLPSRQEGLPLAALEAMDVGLPVVGTEVIGTAEVVVDGETGRLVPPRDARALGSALADLLADPGLRARYGSAGRRRYLDRFTAARMAAETVAVYEDVLAGGGAGRPLPGPAGALTPPVPAGSAGRRHVSPGRAVRHSPGSGPAVGRRPGARTPGTPG
jgi:glycosyltransferase involved in cell wall biosynthesis